MPGRGKKLQMASKLMNKGQFWAQFTAKLSESVPGSKWDKKKFHIWLRVPKNGPNNAKKQGVRQINLKKRTKFCMMVGFFFPNHRIDMQVGVGLHMSHARQNLGTLGGFKTPLR